jgi:argininosuccinate lyase
MSEKVDILRRGRLAAKAKEVNDFTSSVQADRWIFPADLQVDRAHTVMLAKQGIIAKADAAAILKALAAIEKEGVEAVDILAFEDVHMAIESKLIKAVGENAGGRMHSGRSRNDEVATCIRISARRELLELMSDLLELRSALLAVADGNVDTIMPGFTHLQHAQPTTLAHHMLAHVSALDRDFARLLDAYKFVNICPLGSAAFASTGFPLDREYTAKLLGFDRPMDNSMDGVAARDFILDLASRLAIIEVDLSRLADELVLWSTSEFGFVELSDTYASTSSIMPQKKNPDVLELVRGRSGTVIGHMVAAFTIVKGLPYSYNSDLQEVTPQLLRSFEITRSSVRIMAGALQTLTVKKDEMARKSTTGFTTATEIADTIVRATGLPFRTAHGIVGRLASSESSLARGDGSPSLKDVDKASMEMIGKKVSALGLTERMLAEAKDPAKNVERRNILGGPAKATVRRKITAEKKKLASDGEKLSVLREKVRKSYDGLAKAASDITGKRT